MLKAKDLMSTNINSATPNTLISEIATLMKKHNIGIIPICEDDQKLVGIITDRDITIRNVAENKKNILAKEIMTTNLVSAKPDDTIYDVSKLMAEHKIRRIPIIENNKLLGIISIKDIAKTNKFKLEIAETICEIST